MKENNNIIGWGLLGLMFCYSAFLNATLFFSILIGFIATVILVLCIELNDEDIVEAALTDGDISPDALVKISSIFIMAFGMFVVLTTVIYKIITS